MNDTPQTTTQPHVSRLTLGRLHNLGNYEHIRYEVTVEVPPGADPALILGNLERLLDELEPKPPVPEYDLETARRVLAKPASDLTEMDRQNLDLYQLRVAKAAAHEAKRAAARQALNSLGATSVYSDAKDQWEDRY